MKVEDFLAREPVQKDDCIAEAEKEEEFVTSLTPSGIECWYSWAPRRHYKLRSPERPDGSHNFDWREVPSVTTVLNVLDKSGALSWWAQGIACEGIAELVARAKLTQGGSSLRHTESGERATKEDIVALLVSERLSINHVKDSAATRGVNVHSAFEKWAKDTWFRPNPDEYPESERGYVKGLIAFLDDIGRQDDSGFRGREAEVMVGSLEHGFAGRYDLRLNFGIPQDVVVKTYPKRAAKREEIPAGRYLLDLKTSKNCYPSHSIQLAAYELASVECGYGATDYRAVVHVTANGEYELRLANASADDFLSVLQAYNTMQRKDWFA